MKLFPSKASIKGWLLSFAVKYVPKLFQKAVDKFKKKDEQDKED